MIESEFLKKNGQGITVYQGVKGYGKAGLTEKNEIIHIVVNRIDARRINRMIDQIDKEAFVTEFDVNNVKGGKIRRFLYKNSTSTNN